MVAQVLLVSQLRLALEEVEEQSLVELVEELQWLSPQQPLAAVAAAAGVG